jgi:cob(I)alamin adenosyltransferase
MKGQANRMGHRLSKIYTRTGDQGTTGLGDGSRVGKDSPRMDAIGTVDELNSAVGMVLSHQVSDSVHRCLTEVQHDLFNLGGELSMPGHGMIDEAHVARLEQQLDTFNADLPYLKEFILPGGSQAASSCHLARAICRRAERTVVKLGRSDPINLQAQIYLNRLSDLLFVVARVLCRAEGGQEVLWQRGRAGANRDGTAPKQNNKKGTEK